MTVRKPIKISVIGGFAALALAASSTAAMAAPVTLEGAFVRVGVSDAGTMGSGGSDSPGMLHDPLGTGTFGINDYLTPGTPHEGFGISSTQTGFLQNENFGIFDFGSASPTLVASAVCGYDNCASWSGSASGLTILNEYFFNDGDERVNVRTTITAGATTGGFTNLAFVRSVDPDPDVALHGTFATFNSRTTELVASEGEVSGNYLALLNLSGNTYVHNTSIGPSGCCSTELPSTVLAGADGAFDPADYSLNMAWLIGDLAGGQSAVINYAYVFGDDLDVDFGAVPEPSTIVLLGAGLGALVLRRRRAARAA